MMANYEVSKRLENYQYIEGCPIFITGGNILKETETNDMFVNIRLRSLSEKNINAVILDVECFDIEDEPLEGITRYQLLDLNIKGGETFADNKLIRCPDQYTRKCNVIIKKVIFADETKWEFSDSDKTMSFGLQNRFSNWRSKSLTPVLFNEMNDMKYPKEKIIYIPNPCGDHWICTCGSINHNDNNCICGLNKEKLFKVFNEDYLREREKAYQEKQKNDELERQHRRELAAQREEEEKQHRREVELKQLELADREAEERFQESKKELIAVLSVVAVIIVSIIIVMFSSSEGTDNNLLAKKYTIGEKEYSTKIEYLDLSNQNLTNQDIENLGKFTKLKRLSLSNNNISDISCLSTLNSLEELDLYNNNVEDVSALSDMHSLYKLNLTYNNISDISDISELENMQVLWLSYNNISDISALENMEYLEEVVLDNNKITNIESLRDKTCLKELYLNDNYFLNKFDALTECTSLKILNIGYTDYDIDDYVMLKDALPECDVKM